MSAGKQRSSIPQGGEEQSLHHPRCKPSRRRGGDQSTRMVAVEEEEKEELQNPTEEQQGEDKQEDQPPLDEDSDGSGTDPEEFDEVIGVIRSAIRNNDFNERLFFAQIFDARKDVECPICLGIIKKTRTVMGCLHRFCRECIDKSMRLGNNECPACRIHCASRRSLRDNVDFDALIEAIYPDLKEYEEEELVFHEEEKTRYEQVQVSIAQISRRQSEALNKRRRTDRDDLRLPRNGRHVNSRRRNNQRTVIEPDNVNERENDFEGNINPSPSDRSRTEIKNRTKRRTQPPPTLPSVTNPDTEYYENSMEPTREESVNLLGGVLSAEMLTWGRGGTRSHTRHGGGGGGRGTRGSRISKLTEQLSSSSKIDYESEVPFALVSLDKERIPNLEKPFLCLKSNFSVDQLRKLISEETKFQAEDIEVLLVKQANTDDKSAVDFSHMIDADGPLSQMADWSKIILEILEGHYTLQEFHYSSNTRYLILAYQYKKDNQQIQSFHV
ncbi:hypothetical protein ACH5RR_028726 [Cinchona calisaya]|uniref:RING-type domain-containing protein n=1 Tax=Cinchona calisaya TaxID=153742 RepID=A0ABD2YT82_9GENT